MNELRELQTGTGTDLVRALLDELDLSEWVPRYAVVLLDAVDERDKRIAELEAERDKLQKACRAFVNLTRPFVLVSGEVQFEIFERDYKPVLDQAREALPHE